MPAVPPNGAPESSTFFWTVAGSGVVWNGGAWDVTLPVGAGDVVTSISIVVRDNAGATPNRVTARLQAQTAAGIVQVGAISSDMSGNTQTLVLSLPSAHVVAADERLFVQAVPWTATQQLATLNSMVGNIVVTTEAPSQLLHIITTTIPGVASSGMFGTPYSIPQGSLSPQMTGASAAMGAPLVLNRGDHITSVRFFIKDNTSGPTRVAGALSAVGPSGTVSDVAVSSLSSGTGANQTLSIQPSCDITSPGTSYVVWVKTIQGSASVTVNGYEVDRSF